MGSAGFLFSVTVVLNVALTPAGIGGATESVLWPELNPADPVSADRKNRELRIRAVGIMLQGESRDARSGLSWLRFANVSIQAPPATAKPQKVLSAGVAEKAFPAVQAPAPRAMEVPRPAPVEHSITRHDTVESVQFAKVV